MKVFFLLACIAGHALAVPADVFRYVDEDTKQGQYQEGEPGVAVSGGWNFESPEGKTYELSYKADEMGFQPVADHLPVQVDDTPEVAEARANFYSLFEGAQQRSDDLGEDLVETTTAEVDDREKREAEDEVEAATEADVEVKSEPEAVTEDPAEVMSDEKTEKDTTARQLRNYFYFNNGYFRRPVFAKRKLVYHPYYGYIPVPEKKMAEETEAEEAEAEPDDDAEPEAEGDAEPEAKETFVFDALKGFVPSTEVKEADKWKYPIKFEKNDVFGYVPVTEAPKEFKPSNEKYVYHPFKGFVPISKLDEADKDVVDSSIKFQFNPQFGFLPIKPEMMKDEPEMMEEKPEIADEQPVTAQPEEVAEDASAKEPEKFVYHYFYGFIPVSKITDDNMKKEVDMAHKYVLNPYYGFIPENRAPLVPKNVRPYRFHHHGYKFVPYRMGPKNVYKFNPVADKMKAMTEEMKREKRDLTYAYPAYHYPAFATPLLYTNPGLPKTNDETETKAMLDEKEPQAVTYYTSKPVYTPGNQFKLALNPYYYFTPYQVKIAQPEVKTVEEEPEQSTDAPEAAEVDEAAPEAVASLPLNPVGAVVAQQPLPEEFPIFPYDPDQDKPAAEAF